MSILDQTARERSLNNDYGATRGPNAPATLEASLWVGHPDDDDGEEVIGGGYARVTFSNDNWLAAADGVKVSLPITFPAATGEYPDTVTYVLLTDPSDDSRWDCVPLDEPLDVTGPGDGPVVTIRIYYNIED